MAKQLTADDFDRVMRRVKFLFVGFAVLICAPLIMYGVYLDRRLANFEDTLRHRPPTALDTAEFSRTDLQHFAISPTEGQIIYVPAYSHVYHTTGDPYLLTITLSIRNTSMQNDILIGSVRYFDTQGNVVKSFVDKPVRLPAMGTTEIIIERDDATGGSGANFLVEWLSDEPVTQPIVEAVMIDTSSNQGISFVRRGTPISEVSSSETTKSPAERNLD